MATGHATSEWIPLPEATVEACIERWQGRCVELCEFLTTVAVSSEGDSTTSLCLVVTALMPPKSPAVLLSGAHRACLSFARQDEMPAIVRGQRWDVGLSAIPWETRDRMIARGVRWGRRHLGETAMAPATAIDTPLLRRALDNANLLERRPLQEAERNPEVRRRKREAATARRAYLAADQPRNTADPEAMEAAELRFEDAREAAVQAARARLLRILGNERLMGM